MTEIIMRTSRLYLREIQLDDYDDLCTILQDSEVMYAWEHAFSDQEVKQWLNENMMRYERDGYSYWAVIEKGSGELIGVSGIIKEYVENEQYLGLGYIYNKNYWKQGYAFEAAFACLDYAFNIVSVDEMTAQIRVNNLSSRRVAEKLGMTIKKEFIKRYREKDMPHLLYACKNLKD